MSDKYSVKVITVGDTTVGKTSLLGYIKDGIFCEQQATIAVSVVQLEFVKDKIPIKLNIWDTAGQERFRSLIETYYRTARIALICCSVDNPSSFDSVAQWENDVLAITDAEIIYVVTKNDLLPDFPQSEDLITKLQKAAEAKNRQFFRTSSKTGFYIGELKDYLESRAFEIVTKDIEEIKREDDKNNFQPTVVTIDQKDSSEPQKSKFSQCCKI